MTTCYRYEREPENADNVMSGDRTTYLAEHKTRNKS